MAWDTAGTQRKILDAATKQFAAVGPDGTTIERIAKEAGVNKERIYNYFGGKRELLARVLQEELAKVAQAIPVDSFATYDIGDYAGHVYDYHRERPELTRLLHWEGLAFGKDVPNEEARRARYEEKTAADRRATPRSTDQLHRRRPYCLFGACPRGMVVRRSPSRTYVNGRAYRGRTC